MTDKDYTRVLAVIATSEDPDQLRRFINNAKREGADKVNQAAFRRLLVVLPEETPGTIEYDFWRTIFAFEEVLREERGKTVRLSRTRQKVQRVGVMQTVIDLTTSKSPADGFKMLIEREMPELAVEAIVLRHVSKFDEDVVTAATERLVAAGIDVSKLPKV